VIKLGFSVGTPVCSTNTETDHTIELSIRIFLTKHPIPRFVLSLFQ